jgi:hypothetical protein
MNFSLVRCWEFAFRSHLLQSSVQLTSKTVAVALEKSNLGSLRDVQHKDQYGNIISSSPLAFLGRFYGRFC